ncbi:MAG: hypothetical protein U0586_01575, partial [Candidatus Brocadiaceae bacterium]
MTLLTKTARICLSACNTQARRWTSGVARVTTQGKPYGIARETIANAMQEKDSDSYCESLWKKMIGKPYSEKLIPIETILP